MCVDWYAADELKKASGQNNVKKREAVYDKGEQVKGSATYVPKVGAANLNESIAHLLWMISMHVNPPNPRLYLSCAQGCCQVKDDQRLITRGRDD